VIDPANAARTPARSPVRDQADIGLRSYGVARLDERRHSLFTAGEWRLVCTINGRSWPNTDRVAATVRDSLGWRIINASYDAPPMHLHGFYYRVDAFSGPSLRPRSRRSRYLA
jgi:FtsP/CotA-like multicopper oxidase with cupredoxin domain